VYSTFDRRLDCFTVKNPVKLIVEKKESENLNIPTEALRWNLLGVMFLCSKFLQKPCTLSYYIPITHYKILSRVRRHLFVVHEGTGSPSGK